MKTGLILGMIILVTFLMYKGKRYVSRLTRPWFWSILAGLLVIYFIMLCLQISHWLISDTIVMIVALLVGYAFSLTISSYSALIGFCIAAGVADFISFTFSGGLTSKIINDYEHGNNLLLQYLSITIPLSSRMVPIVGIGDLIIIGSIYVSLNKLGYNDLFSFLSPLVGLLMALGIGLLVNGIFALPFICGATIIYLLLKTKTHLSKQIKSTDSNERDNK
jgi:hypothetical protein